MVHRNLTDSNESKFKGDSKTEKKKKNIFSNGTNFASKIMFSHVRTMSLENDDCLNFDCKYEKDCFTIVFALLCQFYKRIH